MEFKDPEKLVQELNASTRKMVEGINKNVKELTESRSLKELAENVQEDFTEIHDLTKKMRKDNMNDVYSKVLKKTEDLQEKIQKFHDFIENSVNESAESVSKEETVEEGSAEEPVKETTVEDALGEPLNENNQ